MNYLYKHLVDAGFEIEIEDGEVIFDHPKLGRATFADWSQTAHDQIKTYIEQLKELGIKSRDEEGVYENNKGT